MIKKLTLDEVNKFIVVVNEELYFLQEGGADKLDYYTLEILRLKLEARRRLLTNAK